MPSRVSEDGEAEHEEAGDNEEGVAADEADENGIDRVSHLRSSQDHDRRYVPCK